MSMSASKGSLWQAAGFLLVALLALPHSAAAQSDERSQIRRLQDAARQAEKQRGQLVQEKTALEAQLKEMQEQVRATQRKSAKDASMAAALVKDLDAAESEKRALSTKLGEISERLGGG